jgi:hypothetical protein
MAQPSAGPRALSTQAIGACDSGRTLFVGLHRIYEDYVGGNVRIVDRLPANVHRGQQYRRVHRRFFVCGMTVGRPRCTNTSEQTVVAMVPGCLCRRSEHRPAVGEQPQQAARYRDAAVQEGVAFVRTGGRRSDQDELNQASGRKETATPKANVTEG